MSVELAADATTTHRFRILALDGGGIRGAFSASVLAELESTTDTKCVDRFDLIVGTSTGGLMAIALALGIPAVTIRDFYVEKGPSIFPFEGRVSRALAAMRGLFTPKFQAAPLRAALMEMFGDSKLGSARTRLVIPAYDVTNGRVFVFKTRHLERFRFDVDASAVDIAMCTSAAPTYFPANLLPEHAKTAYIDGGVWANSPAIVGIVEAVGFLEQDLADIDVLSVGTTSPLPNFSGGTRSGVVGWVPDLVNLFMTAQVQGAVAMAEVLCASSVHRVNAVVPKEWSAMDNTRRVGELISSGQAHARTKETQRIVRERFLNETPIAPFTPATGP